MIRHVFKLIWNRKRTNVLMMTEIFVSFLVLFAVVALGVYTLDNWRRPLGFSIDRVWAVGVDMKQVMRRRLRRGAAGKHPAADAGARRVSGDRARGRHNAGAVPVGSSNSGYEWRGRDDRVRRRRGHRRIQGPAGLQAGRRAGGSAARTTASVSTPVVINRDDARGPVRTATAIGQNIATGRSTDGLRVASEPSRVVGVVDGVSRGRRVRRHEELRDLPQAARAATIRRNRPPRNMLIKVRAGHDGGVRGAADQAAAGGGAGVVVRDHAAGGDAERLDSVRSRAARSASAWSPAFLMLMVALGLLGVLWQTVTQRTREIGLRRAKGAAKVERAAPDPRRDRGNDDPGAIAGVLVASSSRCSTSSTSSSRTCTLIAFASRWRHLSADVAVRLVSEPHGDARRAGRGAAIRVAGQSADFT